MVAQIQQFSGSDKPALDELVERARALFPVLKERAPLAETIRQMPESTIADLKAAGLHKLYVPKRWGGYEMGWGAHMAVSQEIAKACGSTSWIVSLVFSHVIFIGRFPAQAQEELWANNPDAVVATGSAGHGTVKEVDGGYEVSGRWKFVSGIHHADCAMVTVKSDPDAIFSHFAMLMPGQYRIIDSWDTEGLRGTGSHDIEVRDQFVPAHRIVARDDLLGTEPPGAKLHDSYLYRMRPAPYQKSWFAGPLAGTARGALDEYCGITRERIGRMFGESITEQIPVQVRVGETLAEIETAELLMSQYCERLHEYAQAGCDFMGADLLKSKRDMTYASRLCVGAIARLAEMMGAGGQAKNNPVQRHLRDCRAVAAHIELQWDHSMAPTGKYLLGLKTGDPLVDGANGTDEPVDRRAMLGTQV